MSQALDIQMGYAIKIDCLSNPNSDYCVCSLPC